jgi:RecA-family ATPase
MTTTTVKTEAKWKVQFQIMWNNTPKKLRKTITQINNIKSQAKLYTAIWN